MKTPLPEVSGKLKDQTELSPVLKGPEEQHKEMMTQV